jgi:hypothetical protein
MALYWSDEYWTTEYWSDNYWTGLVSVVAPTVTTAAADEITPTTALASGEVTDDGGGTISERGFCYNTTGTPTTGDDTLVVSGTTGAYSGYLTGLDPETTYYIRAYAINEADTSYGSEVSFETVAAIDLLVPGTNFYIEIEMGMGRSAYIESGVTTLIIGAPIGYPIP